MDLEKYGTSGIIQELLRIRDDIEALAETQVSDHITQPKLDLLDFGNSYRLIIEVPGVSQENLELALQGKTLIIAGLREPLEEGVKTVITERPRGHFQRSLDLPSEVKREEIQAHLQEGLLILTLPKDGK
jgi:HSP20 family protein